MGDWRNLISMTPEEIGEMSAAGMAATRIMKGIGSSFKDIGKLCSRFGIPYNEDETPFQRAVSIFKEVYAETAGLVWSLDVRSGDKPEKFYDDMLEDIHSAIVFFRIIGTEGNNSRMIAFVKGQELATSPLGKIVIKPGIRYVKNRGGMQLWEQDPVTLIRSFSRITNTEE